MRKNVRTAIGETMSLTSFLAKNADVRQRFQQEFQKPKFSIKRDIVAAPLSKRYGTVGTAFDYLLRFYIQHINPNTIDKGPWIAEAALKKIEDRPDILAKGENIVFQARKRLREYLKTGKLSDDLLESALLLATLDPLFRAQTGYEVVGEVQKEDIQDLRNLITAVDPKVFTAKKLCLLNPTFGQGSLLVGGADADLLIDDTLIDFKTTKNFALGRKAFNQILGYFILHEIAGIGELKPKPMISKVAIYYSRHSYLHVMNLSELINPRTFPEFVGWFKARAKIA